MNRVERGQSWKNLGFYKHLIENSSTTFFVCLFPPEQKVERWLFNPWVDAYSHVPETDWQAFDGEDEPMMDIPVREDYFSIIHDTALAK